MHELLLFHYIFNARLYFTERNAHIVTRIEAIASLGFNYRQCPKSLLAQIRGCKWEQKSHCFVTNYRLFLFNRIPELSKLLCG